MAKEFAAHSQKAVILNLDQPWEERINQDTRGDTDPFSNLDPKETIQWDLQG
jgi:hypothetical protein